MLLMPNGAALAGFGIRPPNNNPAPSTIIDAIAE
jgi:hypothetical protein